MTDYERDTLLGEVKLAEKIDKIGEECSRIIDKAEKEVENAITKRKIIHTQKAEKEFSKRLKEIASDMRADIEKTLDAEGIIQSEAQDRVKLIRDYGGKVKVSSERLKRIIDTPCVSGYTIGQELDSIESGFYDIWLNNVRLGRLNGWTAQKVVKTVLEGFGDVSYTHKLRTQIVRDSRTALQYFANEAKTEVYRENEDIFSGYKWLATLDTRVCHECAKLDGEIRKNLDDFDTPPLHYNCRCTIVPIVEGMDITHEPISMDELNENGKAEKTDTPTKAASSKSETVFNSAGQEIRVVKKVNSREEPDSLTQTVTGKGGITRSYYDSEGKLIKQISNNDHGHEYERCFGKHGEHAHDYIWNKDGTVTHDNARELTAEERKENEDML